MRKHFILGIMALAALASCTKSEVLNQESQQEKGITFSAYVGKATQTKSTPLASDNISDAGIGLLAWRTADVQVTPADDATLTNDAPSFMPNLKLYKDAADAWVYSPTRYWPSTGAYVSFYAYAPYFDVTEDYSANPSDYHPENISIGNIANITSAGGQHKITLTVPSNETGTEYSKHTDFMVARVGNGVANADGTWSGMDANNKTVGINQNLNKDYPDAVKLQMKHALSKISFVGKSGNTTESYEYTKVIIDDITINGKFASQGTYNLLKEEWSDLTSQNAYKYANTDGTAPIQDRYTNLTTDEDPFTEMADEFISSVSEAITGSDWYRLTKSTHDIMVIPFSTTDGTDVIPATIENVTGHYTVVTYSDESCSTVLDVDQVEFNAPINITLEEGKAYQFQLDIELKKITFNVNVEEWLENDANKYDVVNTNITNQYSVTDESSFNLSLPDWYKAAHPWDANTAATLPWLVVELTPTPANKLNVSVTTPAGDTIDIPNERINPNNSTKTVTLLTLCAEEIFGQGTSETIGTGKWIVTVNNKSTEITM